MNLRVYLEDGTFRLFGNLKTLLLEFDRNMFHAEYLVGNTLVKEEGELSLIFPDGLPEFLAMEKRKNLVEGDVKKNLETESERVQRVLHEAKESGQSKPFQFGGRN